MVGRTDQNVGICDVIDATAVDGEVRCSLGYVAQDLGIDDGAEAWAPWGYYAMPRTRTDSGVALAFYLKDANRKHIIGFRDNRYAPMVGQLEPGDIMIATGTEARVVLKHEKDAVGIYTVNQKVDQSMMVMLDGQAGELNLLNGKAYITSGVDASGEAYISIGVAGGGAITLFEKGAVQVDGTSFNCKTGGGTLGMMSIGELVFPPQAPAMSILYGPSGMAGIPSAKWTIFP